MRAPTIAEMRKTAVAAVGVLAQAIALGVLQGSVLHSAQLVVAAATAFGVYQVPNERAKVEVGVGV